MRIAILFLLTTASISSAAKPATEVVCSYAPSQSNLVAAISSAAVGGAGATAAAVAAATGLTAVVHSSGALILTGTSGYIAGTLGTSATAVAAAPVVIAVGLVVGGTAVTLEIVCAAKNHPDQVAKITSAASEFSRRFGDAMQRTKVAADDLKKSISPAVGRTAIEARRTASNVWQYVYRKSGEVSTLLNW